MVAKSSKTSKASADAAQIAEKLVWSLAEDGKKAAAELTAAMEHAVPCLAENLSEANDDATVQGSFALEAMVMAALAPEKGGEAEALAGLLAKELPKAKDDTARCILLKYLQLLAEPATVPALSEYLQKEPTLTYATMALRVINNEEACNALGKAAAKSRDAKKKAILLSAALEMNVEAEDLEEKALALLRKGDFSVEAQMLWKVLSLRQVEGVIPFVAEGLKSPSKTVHGVALAALWPFMESCQMQQEVFHLMKSDRARESAMAGAFFAIEEQDDIISFWLEAFRTGDKVLRHQIVKLLEDTLLEDKYTEMLVAFGTGLEDPEQKADLLYCLGLRGKLSARNFVMSCLNDKNPVVRTAALEAARKLPGDNVPAAMLAGIIKAAL